MKKLVACTALAAIITPACKDTRREPGSARDPTTGAVASKNAAGTTSAAGGAGENLRKQVAENLTDEKMAKFIIFRREVLAKNSGSTLEERHRKALEKSKLDPSDLAGITLLVSEYFPKKAMALDDENELAEINKRIEAAKKRQAIKEESAFDVDNAKRLAGRLEKFRNFRDEFQKKYGPGALAILDKHSQEMAELQARTFEAMIAPGIKETRVP